MKKDSLGDRMKEYEVQSSSKLLRRVPVIVRIDGKAFHQFTKHLQKPYCIKLHSAMINTMKGVMGGMQGAKFGYTQSDEISILLMDTDQFETEAWFNNKLQKICSVSASLATAHFNASFTHPDTNKPFALFDARVFNIPEHDVVNYFIWRQQDAIRNSIQMLGQHYFSHKQLQGKSCNKIKQMLMEELEHPVSWDENIESWAKQGSCYYDDPHDIHKIDCPMFTSNRNVITNTMTNIHIQDKK